MNYTHSIRKRRCLACHEETEQVQEGKALEQEEACEEAAGEAEEAVWPQVLVDNAFAQTVGKEYPTNWERPVMK